MANDMTDIQLPGLDCGLCGYRTCDEFKERLADEPEMLDRCIHLSQSRIDLAAAPNMAVKKPAAGAAACSMEYGNRQADAMRSGLTLAVNSRENMGCGTCVAQGASAPCSAKGIDQNQLMPHNDQQPAWRDHLGREFDFYLEHFPEEPGPREIILPHNPMITREMEVKVGDVLIGRPLGISCGCPITHCGIATQVDSRTGVIAWCVTGPLGPRQHGYKDLGYYIAEGYEGLVKETRCELKIGMRYFFQPRMCMLQWRHSGLLNYLSRNQDAYQVRLEGLWIG